MNAIEKASRFFRLRQQSNDIKTNGKKVSFVATPSAQINPVTVAVTGIRRR